MTRILRFPFLAPTRRSFLNRLTAALGFHLSAFLLCLLAILLPFAARAATTPLVPMATHPSGGAALFTAVADVNGDGHQDVFASNTNGVISLLLGQGNGAFLAPETIVTLTTGSFYPIVTADFNRDGHPDLAVLDPAKASVLIFLGKGDGTFSPAKTAVVSNAPTVMLVDDINGDHSPDLVFNATKGSGSSAQVGFTLLLGLGNGSFHAPAFILANNGGAGGVMAIGDLNRDGHPDVLTCNGSGYAEVFLGNGNGTFREQPAFGDGVYPIGESQFLLADLYGNGNLDLVVGNFGSQLFGGYVTLLEGLGDGTFSHPTYLTAGFYPAWFAAADMNGDGKLDLLVANSRSNSVTVLINHGSGNFTSTPDNYATQVLLGGPGQGPMTVADFNGDHKPDVVVASNFGVDILLNLGAGVLYAPASVEVGYLNGPMFAADFNSDGHTDIAIETWGFDGNVGEVDLLTGDGKGNLVYSEPFVPESPAQYGPFAVGSFNGNGKPGAAGYLPGGQMELAYNDGHASFSNPPAFNLAQEYAFPTYLCAGDFNGDGYSDLAVLDFDEVDIYLNTHDGNFSGPVSYKLGSNPVFIIARDLNHDGKLDLVTVNQGSNDISVLMGKGNGAFALAKDYPAGTTPNVVTTGDFNRDGKIDLAVGDTNKISILLGHGDGTFASAASYPSPVPVTYLALASLRGVGIEDLLAVSNNYASNSNPQYLYQFPGKGDGTFGSPVAVPAGINPSWIAVADFNQDGAQDVAVSNYFGNETLLLFLNQRGTRIALKSSAATALAGHPVTFTAILSASVPGSAQPAGTIAFKDGAKAIGTAQLAGGKATFTTSALTLGSHTIAASYWGNSSFNPHVSAPVVVKVN